MDSGDVSIYIVIADVERCLLTADSRRHATKFGSVVTRWRLRPESASDWPRPGGSRGRCLMSPPASPLKIQTCSGSPCRRIGYLIPSYRSISHPSCLRERACWMIQHLDAKQPEGMRHTRIRWQLASNSKPRVLGDWDRWQERWDPWRAIRPKISLHSSCPDN